MAVRATLRSGETVKLAGKHGDTPATVLARLEDALASSLTGSAVPDLWLETDGGSTVRYTDVVKLDPEPDD